MPRQPDHSPLRSDEPLTECLSALLAERGMSVRALARRCEVSPAYVSRLARRQKTPSGDVAARIAVAMGLPRDYFPETRAQLISERLNRDPALRDRIYDHIFRGH